MKGILTQQVKRGNGTDDAKTLKEWEPAEHQATMDGLNAFAARQRARMQEAQQRAAETSRKVRALGGKR